MDDESIAARLRSALRAAMKSKDPVAAAALRSALAAIANAEAVPQEDRAAAASQHIAGGTAGLASAEAERRTLTPEDAARIIENEICERQTAARQYETADHPERAARLRREAEVIRSAIQG